MSEHFRFDSDKYEFGLIQQSIEKYYSLNAGPDKKEEKDNNENTYNGKEVVAEITYDNVGVAKNYKARWQPFAKFLRQKLKKPINGTIYLSNPCFQGYLTIEKITGHHYELTKELHFAISLLGPYYTVYGLDKSVRMLQMEPGPLVDEKEFYGYYDAANAITVSPCFEYESRFLALKNAIATWFPAYRFVPFAINKMRIPGLCASMSIGDDKDSDRIYSALFNDNIDFSVPARGDIYYGYDDWKIAEIVTAEDHANEEIIAQHIKQNQLSTGTQTATIHKVWKYKSADGWRPFLQANGIGMMSIETFDLLDLTELHTVRYTKPQSAKVYCQDYEIVAERLIIQADQSGQGQQFKCRVVHLAANELRLTLAIDFTVDNRRIQGEVCEFTFAVHE